MFKAASLLMFIALPFIGFLLGRNFQQNLPLKTSEDISEMQVQVNQQEIPTNPPTNTKEPTQEELVSFLKSYHSAQYKKWATENKILHIAEPSTNICINSNKDNVGSEDHKIWVFGTGETDTDTSEFQAITVYLATEHTLMELGKTEEGMCSDIRSFAVNTYEGCMAENKSFFVTKLCAEGIQMYKYTSGKQITFNDPQEYLQKITPEKVLTKENTLANVYLTGISHLNKLEKNIQGRWSITNDTYIVETTYGGPATLAKIFFDETGQVSGVITAR